MNTSSCAFKFIEYIVNNSVLEKVNNIQIKQILIDFYKNANYPNNLIPYERGSDNNNWSFFSLAQWYSFQTKNTEKIHSQPMNKKNSVMEDIIMHENYMPTELDLFIILHHYNISSIVVSANKGFVISPSVRKIIIGDQSEEKYIILVKVIKEEKVPKKNLNSSISFGLLKVDNNEKITPENIKERVKKNLPISINKIIELFINSRLSLQNKTKESKKKRLVKKLGKKKLG